MLETTDGWRPSRHERTSVTSYAEDQFNARGCYGLRGTCIVILEHLMERFLSHLL